MVVVSVGKVYIVVNSCNVVQAALEILKCFSKAIHVMISLLNDSASTHTSVQKHQIQAIYPT